MGLVLETTTVGQQQPRDAIGTSAGAHEFRTAAAAAVKACQGTSDDGSHDARAAAGAAAAVVAGEQERTAAGDAGEELPQREQPRNGAGASDCSHDCYAAAAAAEGCHRDYCRCPQLSYSSSRREMVPRLSRD